MTTAKIYYTVFSAIALILAQFWSCSTAQSLQPLRYKSLAEINTNQQQQEEQAQEDKGSAVLVFKLLSPIKPDDNKQVVTVTLSKGNQTNKSIACLPTINPIEMPFLLAGLTRSNWAANPSLNQDDSFENQGYSAPTQGRAPPFLI